MVPSLTSAPASAAFFARSVSNFSREVMYTSGSGEWKVTQFEPMWILADVGALSMISSGILKSSSLRTFGVTPPPQSLLRGIFSFSSRSDVNPSCAARLAAEDPAGPAPITIRSYV